MFSHVTVGHRPARQVHVEPREEELHDRPHKQCEGDRTDSEGAARHSCFGACLTAKSRSDTFAIRRRDAPVVRFDFRAVEAVVVLELGLHARRSSPSVQMKVTLASRGDVVWSTRSEGRAAPPDYCEAESGTWVCR